MAELDRQYRPIANTETAGDDSATVRIVRELADSMNNYKANVAGAVLVNVVSPKVVGHSFTPYPWHSGATSTDELAIHMFAPRFIGDGYNRIHFQIAGELNAAAAGTCTWKLYASQQRYTGPLIFDVNYLGPLYDVSTGIVINSTTHMIPAAVTDLQAIRDKAGDVYLTLTAENSLSGANEYATLSAIAATAKVELT